MVALQTGTRQRNVLLSLPQFLKTKDGLWERQCTELKDVRV